MHLLHKPKTSYILKTEGVLDTGEVMIVQTSQSMKVCAHVSIFGTINFKSYINSCISSKAKAKVVCIRLLVD
jgi:hypothetical protein